MKVQVTSGGEWWTKVGRNVSKGWQIAEAAEAAEQKQIHPWAVETGVIQLHK